jgi:cytochrome c oxidase subunit II
MAGCQGRLSALDPAGPAGASIAALWWGMLGGAAAIFALVMLLLALAWRRREPSAAGEGRWLVGGGLVFPLAVLAALLAWGLVIGERLLAAPAVEAWRVEVRAEQWQWRFRHADAARSAGQVGRLDIPAGRPVELRVSSADVIHSVWVPRLAGKIDAVPGKLNTLRIEAAAPGRYEGVCAEYCGTGHTAMRFVIVAHDAAGWAAWREGARP